MEVSQLYTPSSNPFWSESSYANYYFWIGYSSNVASSLQAHLLNKTAERDLAIHSRVLGNVLYLMTSQVSEVETVRTIEGILLDALQTR